MSLEDAIGGGPDFTADSVLDRVSRSILPDLPENVSGDAVLNRLNRKLTLTKPVEEEKPEKPEKAGKPDFSSAGTPVGDLPDLSSYGTPADAVPLPRPRPAGAPQPSAGIGSPNILDKAALQGAAGSVGGILQGAARLHNQAQPYLQSLQYDPEGNVIGQAPVQPAAPIEQHPLYQAGKTIKDLAPTLTPEESNTVAAKVGQMGGAIAPYAIATVVNPLAGMGAGAIGMGLDTYNSVYEDAKAKGADDATASKAAGRSALVAGVLGSIPLGAGKYAQSFVAKAASSSAAFATAGEAQEWLLQEIAKDYDPKAGYTFDAKRLIAEIILGTGMAGLHHAAESRPAAAEQPAAEAPQPDAQARAPDQGLPPPVEEQPASAQSTGTPPPGPDTGASGPQGGPQPGPDTGGPGAAEQPRAQQAPPPGAEQPEPEPVRGAKEQDFSMDPRTRAKMEKVFRQFEPDTDPSKMSDADLFNALQEHLRDTSSTGYSAKPETAEEKTARQETAARRAEDEILRKAGWSDAHINAMRPDQRAEYVARARGERPSGSAGPEATKSEKEPEPATGTREAPIRPATADDVVRAQASEPTPAQAIADNYKQAHVELPHLGLSGKNGITIETGVGGTRKSKEIGPDGKPTWETTMQHGAYGKIRGTKGADGDHLDIFVGPHPQSPHVFVVDQLKPDGSFDEHKVLAGYRTPIDAMHGYINSYDDLAKGRLGGMTAFTPDEFKDWLKNGDHTKQMMKGGPTGTPVSAGPAEAAVTSPSAEAQEIRGTGPEPTESKHTSAESSVRKPTETQKKSEPLSLLQFVASKGGIKPHPELAALDLNGKHRVQLPGQKGFFGVVRPGGEDLDRMREAAEEAGYLRGEHNKTSTVRDFLDAIDNELRGQRASAEGEELAQGKREKDLAAERERHEQERDEADYGEARRNIADAGYTDLPADLYNAAAKLVADEGMDPDSAVERAAARLVGEDSLYPVTADDFDITYGKGAFDAIQAGAASENGEPASRPRAERARPGEGEEDRANGERVPAAGAESGQDQDVIATNRDAIEKALGPDADRVSQVDIASAAEMMADHPDMDVAAAFGRAVIQNAVRQKFLTALEAAKAYGKEIETVLEPGREGPSGSRVHPEPGRSEPVKERTGGGGETGELQSGRQVSKPAVAAEVQNEPVADTGGKDTNAERNASREAAPAEAEREAAEGTAAKPEEPKPTVEKGAEGKPQLVIPGAEKAPDADMAQRAANAPLKPKVAQKGMEVGLFGDEKNQTDFGFAEPKSLAFKKWFGDSKVVDDNGNPIVVYHGGPSDITAFDMNKVVRGVGFHFGSLEHATLFGNPQAVYLSIKNPYEGDILETDDLVDRSPAQQLAWRNGKIAEGYDGAIFHGSDTEYVAFDPTQIKSATGNSGKFNPKNPSILAEPTNPFGRGAEGQAYTLAQGRKSGQEHLVAYDASGNEIGRNDGNERFVTLTPELNEALHDPNQDIVVHHNHPNNSSLSAQDVAMLGMPGLRAVWAHGHGGDSFRGELRPDYKATLPSDPNRMYWGIVNMISRIETRMKDAIRRAIHFNTVTVDQANPAFSHLVNVVLRDAGLLDYQTNFDLGDFIERVPGLSDEIKGAAETARREAFSGNAANRPDDRRARPVRHPGDVGAVFDRAEVAAPVNVEERNPPARAADRQREAPRSTSISPKEDKGVGGTQPRLLENEAGFAQPDNTFKKEKSFDTSIGDILRKRLLGRLSDLNLTEARVQLQDKFLRVKKAEESKGNTNSDLSAYQAESLYYGRTGHRLEQLRDNHIDPIIREMKGRDLDLEDVDKFLYARHAVERNRKVGAMYPPGHPFHDAMNDPNVVGGSGMSKKQAQDILNGVGTNRLADYKAVAAMIDALNYKTRRTLLDSGLIDRDTFDSMNNAYKWYVPLRGWAEGSEDEASLGSQGSGNDIRGDETKQAFGRKSLAASPMAYSLMQAELAIVRAEKNKVGNTFLRFVRSNPDPALWTIDRPDQRKSVSKVTGLVTSIDNGLSYQADNVFATKVDGKTVHITLKGPDGLNVARGLKNMGTAQVHAAIRMIASVTHAMAKLATSWNPNFMIPNLVRDLGEAFINLQAQQQKKFVRAFAGHIIPAIRGSMLAIASKQPIPGNKSAKYIEAFHRYDREGGRIHFFGIEDPDKIEGNVNAKLKRLDGGLINGVKDLGEKASKAFEIMGGGIENATRLAAFMAAEDAGLSTPDAAMLARNLTVDFNKKGELGSIISSLYMFSNAGAQGVARALRALGHKRVWAMLGALAAASAMAALYDIGAGGEDEAGTPTYMKIPPWERDKNIIIMLRNGSYAKIPTPYGFAPFGVAGAHSVAVLMGKEKPGAAGMAIVNSVVSAFNPLGEEDGWAMSLVPSPLRPAFHIAFNKDWTGKPLYPDGEHAKGMPASGQSFRTNSAFSKEAAKDLNKATGGNDYAPGLIDVHPGAIDHMMSAITGGIGKFVKDIADTIMTGATDHEWQPEKTPILRRFVGKVGADADRFAYYEARDAEKKNEGPVAQAKKDMKAGINQDEAQKVIEGADNHQARIFKNADKQMSRLRKEEAAATNETLPYEEKKARLDAIRQEMRDVQNHARAESAKLKELVH